MRAKRSNPVGSLLFYFVIIFFLLGTSCGTTSSEGQSTTSSVLEDSNELLVALTIPNLSGKGDEVIVYQFDSSSDFDGESPVLLSISVDLADEEGEVGLAHSFVDFQEGTYYLRVFLDENENEILDAGEIYGVYQSSDKPKKVKVKETSRQGISIRMDEIE